MLYFKDTSTQPPKQRDVLLWPQLHPITQSLFLATLGTMGPGTFQSGGIWGVELADLISPPPLHTKQPQPTYKYRGG